MQNRASVGQKKQNLVNLDTIESLKSTPPSGMARTASRALGDIGAGIGKGLLDTFLGTNLNTAEQGEHPKSSERKTENFQRKGEFTRLYDSKEIAERREMEQILMKIHQEIEAIKKASAEMADKVKEVEKLTISSADIKTGVYHIRFLELVLSFLQTVRANMGDSNIWMEAMQTKRKKRGSLFATLSKKHGTSYSQSQEHSITRSSN